MGGDARTRAEAECREIEGDIEELDGEIGRLHRRDDDRYVQWRLRAHARRYAPAACERILEAEFVIA